MKGVTAEVTGLTDLMVRVPGESWQKGSLYNNSVGLAAMPMGPAGALMIFAGATWATTGVAVKAIEAAVARQVRASFLYLVCGFGSG
jgi:hypothetical protein